MKNYIATKITKEKCNGCGLCVKVCPYQTIAMEEKKAVIVGQASMHCGHCEAVCPTGAIKVECLSLISPNTDGAPKMYQELVSIMHNRRSCRNYKSKPVNRETLEDLVTCGILAPSGTNSQKWTFTIVSSRSDIMTLAKSIGNFFRQTNKLAKSRTVRLISKIFMDDSLGKYYREHLQTVEEALDNFDKKGIDHLFHGAPAAIIISTKPNTSTPVEDALMASQNIVLSAEALGLGTCLIGFAVEAMSRDKKINTLVGIPPEEKVHSVIAIGHPSIKYARPAGRKKPLVRYMQSQG